MTQRCYRSRCLLASFSSFFSFLATNRSHRGNLQLGIWDVLVTSRRRGRLPSRWPSPCDWLLVTLVVRDDELFDHVTPLVNTFNAKDCVTNMISEATHKSHYFIIVEMCVCLCVHDQLLTKITFQLFQHFFMVLGGKKLIKKFWNLFLKIFIVTSIVVGSFGVRADVRGGHLWWGCPWT